MRIMTSNVWGDYFNNPVDVRIDGIIDTYLKYYPDVIGLQEITDGFYKSEFFPRLSENYRLIGTAEPTNYTPILIKKSLSIIAYGFEYLKNTPDTSKSITYAVLETQNHIKFAVCNTHFWWMTGNESDKVKEIFGVSALDSDEHNAIRRQNGKQLFDLMKHLSLKYNCPAYGMGDMNATITEPVFSFYSENGVKLLFDLAIEKDITCTLHGDPILGSDGKYHGKRADDEYVAKLNRNPNLPHRYSSIDHIVSVNNSFTVTQYRVVEDRAVLDATDHSPVYADIKF